MSISVMMRLMLFIPQIRIAPRFATYSRILQNHVPLRLGLGCLFSWHLAELQYAHHLARILLSKRTIELRARSA